MVQKITSARIPTPVGEFELCFYYNSQDGKEHLALVMGDVAGRQNVLVRIHSECFTGDVLGSLRCDCGAQLERAMQLVAHEKTGVIVYLRQEGRGIGLRDKLRAYNLQDMGYDTVDANLMLGHQADGRDYSAAALILQDLGVHSLRLITNNPQKIEGLEALGVNVTQRVPLQIEANVENAAYLSTKMRRMRHMLPMSIYGNGSPDQNAALRKPDEDHLAAFIKKIAQPATQNGRPSITLSYAQSVDGSITHRQGRPMAISGPQSLTLTHQLRATHDAILVGIGTVLADDPRLTVRLVQGKDPQPVILDSRLRFPLPARLLQDPARQPWIATTPPAPADRQAALEAAGARVLRLAADDQGQVDLTALLECLAKQGIGSLMVEGGATVITSFLAARLADRLVLTVAPVFVGGLNAVHGLAERNGHALPHLHNLRTQRVGKDMVLFGDVAWDQP